MNKSLQNKRLLAVVLFALTAVTVTARSWRINNDVSMKADFVSINAAMSSSDVLAGDTLYMDPGCSLTETQTVSKQVTIVGPGYLRTSAPHNFAYITGDLHLKAPFTKVEGMHLQGTIYVQASSCTIERCRISNYTYIGHMSTTAQYTTIRQSYITSYIGGCGSTSAYSSNATIENCIMFSNTSYALIYNLMNPTIRNNYIKNTYTGTYSDYCCIENVSNANISNNILIHKSSRISDIFSKVTNSIVTKNVMSAASNSTYPENYFLNSDDESLVFALEGTNDQKYQLKADSPAKGYATDGKDCGPYAGLYPYVIGGMPMGYPYYTKAVVGTKANEGKVNVSLNIKMQND